MLGVIMLSVIILSHNAECLGAQRKQNALPVNR
jgi:hypothetical protein